MASAMLNLDILSADSFPDTAPIETLSSSGSTPALPLGIVLYSDTDQRHGLTDGVQDTPKKGQTTKKGAKRTRPGAEGEADNATKKRGRPRVDTRDETASERRRTQIRLAQRAYRLRKESVISSLHKRVEELEKTVEQMSEAFLTFNDEAMSSGVLSSHPQLAQLFRRTTQRFLSLAKVANPDPTQDDDDSDMAAQNYAPTPPECEPSHSVSPHEAPSTTFSTPSLDAAMDQLNSATVSLIHPGSDVSTAMMPQFSKNPEWSYLDSLFSAGLNMLELKLPQSLDTPQTQVTVSPYTYSFQETTFSRRLHRRCIELGFALLTSPSCNPSYLQRKFKLTFTIATRNQLANAFQFLMQRKAGEPLEFWNKPYYYLGGAGTHFPRKDEWGNVVYPPNMHPPERAVGPLCFNQGETVPSHQSVEEIIEAAGFGGLWFDCNDVEAYAASKGIYLDSSSTYVDVPPAAIVQSPSGYGSPTSMTNDTFDPDIGTLPLPGDEPLISSSDLPSFQPSLFSPCAQDALRFLGLDSETLGAPQLDSRGMGTAEIPQKQIMDVDLFVNELIKRGVCLGRAPGFRQKDVDSALQSSIVGAR